MLGDGTAIGTKFGISFMGKWVWGMKDFIDLSFMHLFDPRFLFEDYEKNGTDQPSDHTTVFDEDQAKNKAAIEPLRAGVEKMDAETAAKILGCSEDEEEFHERFLII